MSIKDLLIPRFYPHDLFGEEAFLSGRWDSILSDLELLDERMDAARLLLENRKLVDASILLKTIPEAVVHLFRLSDPDVLIMKNESEIMDESHFIDFCPASLKEKFEIRVLFSGWTCGSKPDTSMIRDRWKEIKESLNLIHKYFRDEVYPVYRNSESRRKERMKWQMPVATVVGLFAFFGMLYLWGMAKSSWEHYKNTHPALTLAERPQFYTISYRGGSFQENRSVRIVAEISREWKTYELDYKKPQNFVSFRLDPVNQPVRFQIRNIQFFDSQGNLLLKKDLDVTEDGKVRDQAHLQVSNVIVSKMDKGKPIEWVGTNADPWFAFHDLNLRNVAKVTYEGRFIEKWRKF